MPLDFNLATGRMVITQGGRTAFDTSVPMARLVPSAQISLAGYNIDFPDLYYGVGYRQTRNTVGTPAVTYFACSTWAAPVQQEWGPVGVGAGSFDHNLPEIVVGTVPAGTNYLDCRVNLTQTIVPSNIIGLGLSDPWPQGQWVKLEGGSCYIERMLGVSRLFEFILVGTNVVLRRYQSVSGAGNTSPALERVNPPGGIGNIDFFYPGTNAPTATGNLALYGQLIDSKGPSTNDTHRPPGKESGSSNNSPCSMSTAGINYASRWSGSVNIIPGQLSS